jgi:prepilin-type N-terminal cleavage/methylation domain-containing protein
MFLRICRQPKGFTFAELLVVIGVATILLVFWLPAHARTKQNAQRLVCMNNLKQQGNAFKAWADSHAGAYPMAVRAVDGGPAIATYASLQSINNPTLLYAVYQCMSNALGAPRLLICPTDERYAATSFSQLSVNGSLYISYALAPWGSDRTPRTILAGDRNIYGPASAPTANAGYGNGLSPTTAGGGSIALTTNAVLLNNVGYTPLKMHQGNGNMLMSDGSLEQLSSARLRQVLGATGDSTATPGQNVMWFP